MPDIELGPTPGGSANLRGYLAVPDGDGPWPAVVAIHEIFGVNAELRRQADRLAAAGYLTFAPDLFSDGGLRRCVVSTMREVVTSRKGKAVADIEAARTFAAGHEMSTGKVGVIGFCMGGGFALLTATTGWDAAAPNYGVLPRDLEAALTGACPIVASYGGKDVSLRGAAGKLERALTTLGVEHDVVEYPKAGHSFLNEEPFGPAALAPLQRVVGLGPEPESATDAWARIEAFFEAHLTG